MSDISLRFSAAELMLVAYIALAPLLMAVAMALRALGEAGRIRHSAIAGLVAFGSVAADLAMAYYGAAELLGPIGRSVLLAAGALAWMATALLAKTRRWLDVLVVLLPALSGAALVWLGHA